MCVSMSDFFWKLEKLNAMQELNMDWSSQTIGLTICSFK